MALFQKRHYDKIAAIIRDIGRHDYSLKKLMYKTFALEFYSLSKNFNPEFFARACSLEPNNDEEILNFILDLLPHAGERTRFR